MSQDINNQTPAEPAATNAGQPYILIAEDTKFYAKIDQLKFQKADFEVQVVGDGQQLIDAARKRKPDLILLDLIMPVKDGFATLQELKADPTLKDIKVLIFSDLSQPADIDKLTQMGASGFLPKTDTSPDQLVNTVRTHLTN